MAAELAASIVAAASTLHEQHTERKIVRVVEGIHRRVEGFTVKGFQENGWAKFEDIPRELWLVWHEEKEFEWVRRPDPPSSPLIEKRVPLAQMFAEGWTVEREIKPAADVSYLVLARQAPRPRPGPAAGGV
jgi:hypothetical protein|tara:strand:- start:163 stop:555 length:393 start_codon:yes stop_codon:yes gene_type:complete